MSRVEERELFKFEELSDAAKEKAREWFRRLSDGCTDDFDCTIEDAVHMGEMLGIEFDTHAVKLHGGGTRHDANIWWSGFCSQGDGACFEGTCTYRPGALKALQKEAPASYKDNEGVVHEQKRNAELHRIARELQEAQRTHFYQIVTRVKHVGRYYHAESCSFDHERADGKDTTGDGQDAWDDATQRIEEALKDFMHWVYIQLDAENDYINSDEYIDECLAEGDYEFTIDGEHV